MFRAVAVFVVVFLLVSDGRGGQPNLLEGLNPDFEQVAHGEPSRPAVCKCYDRGGRVSVVTENHRSGARCLYLESRDPIQTPVAALLEIPIKPQTVYRLCFAGGVAPRPDKGVAALRGARQSG